MYININVVKNKLLVYKFFNLVLKLISELWDMGERANFITRITKFYEFS